LIDFNSGENKILREMSNLSRGFNKGNGWILFLVIVSGILIGGFLGELIGQYIPILKYAMNFGVSTHTWNLKVLELTFGFKFSMNMFSVIGILVAIFFYKRNW
jgi:hypothetical protein